MPWPMQTQGGEVNCVATSGDGQIVVAGTYYFAGTVPAKLGTYAYDANANLLWQDVATPTPGDNGIYWVAVSRDGKWAASGGGNHAVPPKPTLGVGYVTAYEVATGNKSILLNSNIGGVNMVAMSGDGSYLVAGADAAYVFARQGSSFAAPVTLRNQLSATSSVVALAISDDGTWVVYGTTDGTIVLAANKPVVPNLPNPVAWTAPANHYIKSLAIAANGSGFAVVTTNRAVATTVQCNAYFFSLNASGPNYFPTTKAPVVTWPLTGCNGTMSVAVTANGSRVAAVGNVGQRRTVSGSVFFFDPGQNLPLWTKPTTHGPNCVSMDGAGQRIAVADGFLSAGAFYLFDPLGANVPIPGLASNQPGVVSWTIQISADGRAIAAGSDDSKVYYFKLGQAPAPPTNLHINQ